MDFFIISQDERIPHPIEPVGVLKVISKDMVMGNNVHKMDELPVQFQIKESTDTVYVDFIGKPVTLVSDKLKEIFSKYDGRIFFKPVFLADIRQTRQDLYWLMVLDSKDCLSSKSEFNKDGTVKRLVIDAKKAARFKIFTIKGIMENFTIIRLDVAESLLRRDFTGFRLTKLEKSC